MSIKNRYDDRSIHSAGYRDAVNENPPANLTQASPVAKEQYSAGYEEGRVEKSERWIITDK